MTDKPSTVSVREISDRERLEAANLELANMKRRYEEENRRFNTAIERAEALRRAGDQASQSLDQIDRHCDAMVAEVTSLTAKATWEQVAAKLRLIKAALDNQLRTHS